MKVAELTGALLDFWVARAEGMAAKIYTTHKDGPAVCVAENRMNFEPSTSSAGTGCVERPRLAGAADWMPGRCRLKTACRSEVRSI